MKISPHTKRYLIIGVSIYGFEVLVIIVSQWLGASSLLAVALSFWLGLLTSFGLQKIVTFGDKRLHHKILIPQFLAFFVLVLFNFGFTLAVTKALDSILPVAIIRGLALGTTTLWNFYLYKTRIFKTDSGPIY